MNGNSRKQESWCQDSTDRDAWVRMHVLASFIVFGSLELSQHPGLPQVSVFSCLALCFDRLSISEDVSFCCRHQRRAKSQDVGPHHHRCCPWAARTDRLRAEWHYVCPCRALADLLVVRSTSTEPNGLWSTKRQARKDCQRPAQKSLRSAGTQDQKP